ncbi:helix-turn-helix domain-containing protein [Pedobacter insulae]|uniref:Helix-turn-helix domain-containing protein n=1 Tax=Pedobacter insulae TaxID=414048 RepID=A0A1I2TE16_9SPHI|nr:helix-turn-helix transcriptional regulator [Pedobacter insulae]SFG62379.1 Helix-turn-helix domain-containing protein [Pedobacter insulae]
MAKFNFGENLRNLRAVRGITQDAIALKLGISQRSYSRIEKRESLPQREQIEIIAKYFDVLLTDLLPPVDKSDPLYVPLKKSSKAKKPVIFWNTSLGNMLIIGSFIAILGATYEFVTGFCLYYKASEATINKARWSVSLIVFVFMLYKVRKIKKEQA